MKDRTLAPGRLCILIAASFWCVPSRHVLAQSAAASASPRWAVPPVLPPGARIAIYRGDPTGPCQSTLLVAMPDGYRLPPHFHPSAEHVEVRQGTLLVGMGDVLDPARTRAPSAGDWATAPAGMHHYSIARGRTVLAVTFTGPYTITYVHAEDAPRPRVFPAGY